jgi:hypothetical protein
LSRFGSFELYLLLDYSFLWTCRIFLIRTIASQLIYLVTVERSV